MTAAVDVDDSTPNRPTLALHRTVDAIRRDLTFTLSQYDLSQYDL